MVGGKPNTGKYISLLKWSFHVGWNKHSVSKEGGKKIDQELVYGGKIS